MARLALDLLEIRMIVTIYGWIYTCRLPRGTFKTFITIEIL